MFKVCELYSLGNITSVTMTVVLGSIFGLFYQNPDVMAQTVENVTSISKQWPNIMSNVKTFVVENTTTPTIENSAFVHPFAVIIGDCHIGKEVLMAPTAVCRADEGIPIYIGDYSNVQDGVILHALDAVRDGVN